MLKKSDPDFKEWSDAFDDCVDVFDLEVKRKYFPILHALKEYCGTYRTSYMKYENCIWRDCETCNVARLHGKRCKPQVENGYYIRKWNRAAKAAYKAEYERLFNKGKKR